MNFILYGKSYWRLIIYVFFVFTADDPTKLHEQHQKIVADEEVSTQAVNEPSGNKENEPPTKRMRKSSAEKEKKKKEKKKSNTKVTKELASVISRFDPAPANQPEEELLEQVPESPTEQPLRPQIDQIRLPASLPRPQIDQILLPASLPRPQIDEIPLPASPSRPQINEIPLPASPTEQPPPLPLPM